MKDAQVSAFESRHVYIDSTVQDHSTPFTGNAEPGKKVEVSTYLPIPHTERTSAQIKT